ncbi:hypothetical protein [Flammeovirga kamogawensis]|uniref:Uncharacterized protein n=1 Tax=Flammeovirga kamogawensis TaxID=373891 RepID=A0ABX8H4M7_9BACT|nr:hypothetical protein [Flammeovirga kamogawensis]MBB6463845.1 hypothetical protein [Flammeovirga kamogawensis]QWG10770.1 hypothetical protein KM029_26790 [Flammeovirga kamogawensis]TRX63244.1 hypothetical protein EO216_26685 [Flammeovirga kamogawensis]
MTTKNVTAKVVKATKDTAIEKEVIAVNDLPEVKYYEGAPLQYRADCKNGKFNINGRKEVGDNLVITPIAWRFFTDDILGMGKKNWVELFFINEQNCLSAIMFHGYSRENLENLASDLFYTDVTLGDINLTISFEKKQNKSVKSTYYIASFEFDVVDEEDRKILKERIEGLKIFRRETLNEDCDFQSTENFFNPHFVEEAQAIDVKVDNN